MRYIIILVCLFAILPFCGCLQGNQPQTTPTASAVNTPASEPTTTGTGSTETTTEALVIPAAEKIKPEIKEEVDKLLPAIGGEDWEAANAAREKLDKLCETNKTDIALFAYLLENQDPEIAYEGANCLSECEDKSLSPEIFDILTFGTKHKSDYVRSKVWSSLRWISEDEALKEKLKELARNSLEDKSGLVRAAVVESLSYAGDKESSDKLKEIMKNDTAPQVVANAIQGLNSMDTDITEDLVTIIKDGIPAMARVKQDTIDDLKNKDIKTDKLEPLVGKEFTEEQLIAELKKSGATKEAFNEIVKQTGIPYVKCYAIEILSQKKNKDIIPLLVKMLDDSTETYFTVDYDNGTPMSYNSYQPTVQKMAVQGLENITGEKFKGAKDDDIDGIVKKWKDWAKKNVK